MHGDYRKFSYEPSLSLIDSTAGSDSFREKLAGIGEGGDVKFGAVMQASGTALISALARSVVGTLLAGVEGTAVGKPKLTIPAISKGPSINVQYDDIVEFNVSWEQSAVETWGAW
jgi:hypothetical protein